MAFSSLLRSTATTLTAPDFFSPVLPPAHHFKMSTVGFNRNLSSAKFQSSIFGFVVPSTSSSLQNCGSRTIQPVKATATEMPPKTQKSQSIVKTKVGINGMRPDDFYYGQYVLGPGFFSYETFSNSFESCLDCKALCSCWEKIFALLWA